MIVLLVGDWKSHALRGLAALLFGLGTLVWPSITVTALVLIFGAFVLVDGVSILAAALAGDRKRRRQESLLVLHGVASVVVGIVALAWTGITALALLYVIATWAILIGAFEVAAAVRLRRVLTDEWTIALAGGLAIVFGVLLVLFPGSGALAITWLIGWFAMFSGVVHLTFAWRLRELDTQLDRAVAGIARPVT
jgi:uncharacterized membrane protein HdeD (DUF308 family)